ncbi:sensor histidine kinase [Streptomyces capitiformicae]|uniref:histidine kinase n=1 Tax=Streptomyces capitiformicae TaxID=2014920 RepID=A0A918ZBB2_9ACTN|nr:HAMP domain-containing sensor histidine kinase [Streptomyces capitiformicae]GHE43041.1 two-component sensor histidine kinase [Streptomyces capitiformicae]
MRRRLFGSVRARATVAATLVVAVALVAAGTAVVLSLRFSLIGQATTRAEAEARTVAAKLAEGVAYADLDLDDGEDSPVQVLDQRGKVVAAGEDVEAMSVTADSRTGRGGTPVGVQDDADDEDADDKDDAEADAEADADADDTLAAGEVAEDATISQGTATIDGDTEDYRFAALGLTTPHDVTLTVYAGGPLSVEQDAVRTALTTMLVGFPLLLLTVGGATYVVTGRALRPVEGIRSEMAAITASEDLSRRVPQPDTHDEVARLARTTNETLAALETSVERQRAFVADASHELRSPIASLRTQLEVGAAHPELLDLDGAVEDTVRLQSLAADLLLLARLDAGERPPPDAYFDLAKLVRQETTGRDGMTVESVDSMEVRGSRGQIARVLANLLDNAQRHARDRVAVSLRTDGDWTVLQVADDGSGVPEPDRARIFERFVRLDESRARDEGGAGLGLAIARDIAIRHGGTLTVTDAPSGGALFELRLPQKS